MTNESIQLRPDLGHGEPGRTANKTAIGMGLYVAGATVRFLRRRGVRFVVREGLFIAAGYAYQRTLGRSRTFTFGGESYPYCCRLYNITWATDRAVEIPIARRAIQRVGKGRVLEVGNVLGHYLPCHHTVVDKYEQTPGIIREDAATYQTDERYDLIVSISTLEHIGWDEEPRDPRKALAVVANLCSLLAPGGRLLFTIPLGYNAALERLIETGELHVDERRYLRRRSRWTEWEETDICGVAGARVGDPYLTASALLVGIIYATPDGNG